MARRVKSSSLPLPEYLKLTLEVIGINLPIDINESFAAFLQLGHGGISPTDVEFVLGDIRTGGESKGELVGSARFGGDVLIDAPDFEARANASNLYKLSTIAIQNISSVSNFKQTVKLVGSCSFFI
ncbi:MAG: hypothetical protein F6K35_41450 [Okeania sp. SIO2H7]|nr:hypothetical protein [Okeania sp. SIO2H7]